MASERGRNLRGAGQPSYWTLVSLDTLLSGGDGHAERSDHGVGVDHGAAVDRADDPVHAQITCLGHFDLGHCALDHQRPHATGGMPQTVPHAGSRAPLPRPCPPPLTAVAAALEILRARSEEHTSELQSPCNLVCRLLLEKKKDKSKHVSQQATYIQHV